MGNVIAPSLLTSRLGEHLRVLEQWFSRVGLPQNHLEACESTANLVKTPKMYTWTVFMSQGEIQLFGFCSP